MPLPTSRMAQQFMCTPYNLQSREGTERYGTSEQHSLLAAAGIRTAPHNLREVNIMHALPLKSNKGTQPQTHLSNPPSSCMRRPKLLAKAT
jgi:hypothetical protein